jgi:hypothetical protein
MNLCLEVLMRFESLDEAVSARTSNISREGLFLKMDPPKPLGTKVRAKVQIAGETFQLEGVVVHVTPDPDAPPDDRPPGVGVFLTAASEGWASICDDLMQRRSGTGDFRDEDTRPETLIGAVNEKVRR